MAVGIGVKEGVAVAATANPAAGVEVGAGEGSPQATPVVTASARTPMTKYLFIPHPEGAGSARPRGRRSIWGGLYHLPTQARPYEVAVTLHELQHVNGAPTLELDTP